MKRFIKGLFMSIITLGVGFAALAFPFHLFGELSRQGMQFLFVAEIVIYLVLGMGYLFRKEKKRERKIRENEKRLSRRAKFERAQEEYYSLAA